MLTGRPPFSGDKGIQVLLAHVHDAVTPPRELRPELPEDLEQVVLRCLAKNPQDRFQDMGSLRDSLLACEAAGSWTRQDAARWWQEPGRMRQG
jgi:serine/threonine-protein kinase